MVWVYRVSFPGCVDRVEQQIRERIQFKGLSLPCSTPCSTPSPLTFANSFFTIQPTRSTRSSSCLAHSRPPVTSHLMFSKRAVSVTAPRLLNNLPSELRTFSLPPPPSRQITKHHIHPAPLSRPTEN